MRLKKTKKGYLVFISHSYRDRWIAKQMARLIEEVKSKEAIKTFLDVKDIPGGDSFPDVIRKKIHICNEFVVLLSAASIDRPWVNTEIGAAWQEDKRIVAILDKISPDDLPEVIEQRKAIDLNDFDIYLEQLENRAQASGDKNEQEK